MEDTMSSSYSSLSADNQDTSETEEFMVQQSQLFSDSLKGLKKIRSQLYSAAEYFEVSYSSDDQTQIVMDILREYTVKALVNAVDHLGSVSHKVNGFISQEVDEVGDAELRACCIAQRLNTCQECINVEGLSQQALVIKGPRHHKHYILKSDTVPASSAQAMSYHEYVPCKDDKRPKQFQNVKGLSSRGRPSTSRIVHSAAPSRSSSPSPLQRARSLSPSCEAQSTLPSPQPVVIPLKDKRAASPLRPSKSLSRAESPTSRMFKPVPRAGSPTSRVSKPPSRAGSPSSQISKPLSRAESPTSQISKPWTFPPERQNSVTNLDGKMYTQMRSDQNPTKSRGFLKSLLTRRRSRNDELLYSYLDEY